MQITFLGTSSAVPTPTRGHSSLALTLESGSIYLFDAGEGTQLQITKSKLSSSKITKIFITHLHGDHMFGLCPLLASMNGFVDRDEVRMIHIYGPVGLAEFVRQTLKYTHTRLSIEYEIHEIAVSEELNQMTSSATLPISVSSSTPSYFTLANPMGEKDNIATIQAVQIQHTIPSLAYILNEPPRPGSLTPLIASYKSHLVRTGSPLSLLSTLKTKGIDITLSDGTILTAPATKKGRKVVICGDTYDASGVRTSELAQDADVVVHESTNCYIPGVDKDTETVQSVEAKTKEHGHSTPQLAGRFAKSVNAKWLLLNHFSSRYKGVGDEQTMEYIRQRAIETFESENVLCAADFLSWDIPKSEEDAVVEMDKL